MIDLSVILPVHNEAKGISKLLSDLKQILKKAKINSEIIFVENSSTDNSYQVLLNVAKKDKNIHVFLSNRGWGNAVKKGIENSHGKYILYMVSNGQVSLKHITNLYDLIRKNKSDMIKVTRVRRENKSRLLNSRIYNLLCIILFGLNTLDVNGTPKIIRSDVLKKIPLRSKNIGIDLELMLKMKERKLKWIEVPIESEKRSWGKSTTNLKSAFEMIMHMLIFKFDL